METCKIIVHVKTEEEPRPFVGTAGTGVTNYTLHEESAFNSTRGEIPFFWLITLKWHQNDV